MAAPTRRPLRRARLLHGVLALLAAGCAPRWSAPVTLTATGTVSAPVAAYIPVYAEVSSGGSPAPRVLDRLTVTCVDPNICATRLVPGSRGTEGRVAGLRVGESDVVVSFVHPTSGKPGELRFRVRFTSGGEVPIAVGALLPPDSLGSSPDELLGVRGVPGRTEAFACHHDDALPLRFYGPPYKRAIAQKAFFSCEPPAEVAPGKAHLCLSSRMASRWNWGDHTGEAVIVCASLRDHEITGLRYYGETPSYASVSLGEVGAVDDTQCPVVDAKP